MFESTQCFYSRALFLFSPLSVTGLGVVLGPYLQDQFIVELNRKGAPPLGPGVRDVQHFGNAL